MTAAYASLLTPGGRSAIAVVAVAGDRAVATVDQYFRSANGLPLKEQPVGRIVYGRWKQDQGEELVVCRRTDKIVEIHCHGGYQSAPQVLIALRESGCTHVDWPEWIQQKFTCRLSAEAHIALTKTTTLRTAKILLDQFHGKLRQAWDEVIAELSRNNLHLAMDGLRAMLQYAELGLHLTRPWSVVIAGLPNVGKSSLINALAGFQRAIVFDQPGTTRDVVTFATAVSGWPLELSDTAGMRCTTEAIESAGIELARDRLQVADLVLWVLDATEVARQKPLTLASEQAKQLGFELEEARTITVVNKIDLVDWKKQGLGTSATTGLGIEDLLQDIATRIVPLPPPPGAAVPFSADQVETLQAALAACENTNPDKALQVLQKY